MSGRAIIGPMTFRPDPNLEKNLQAITQKAYDEAVKRTASAVSGRDQQTVSKRLVSELAKQGIEVKDPKAYDSIIQAIADGKQPPKIKVR